MAPHVPRTGMGVTMKPIRLLLAALAVVGLTACYTSDTPLISDDDAATPFAKITFKGSGADDKPAAFTRDGKVYVTAGEDGEKVFLRLKPVEGDYYVAQMTGTDKASGEAQILYAYLRIDVAAKTAETYRSYGTKDDVRPGLRACKDVVCIDDLNAYIAYAKEAIAANAKPDTTFSIVVE